MRRVVRTLYSLDAEQADELLTRAGIEPEVRPETLSVEQFVGLMKAR
jgi:16S rRNA A1518/A1519 N6-dimethyltransferase RsmA/KsgA/DIM1 with predicted DNA glycosylase/AP lyase activity